MNNKTSDTKPTNLQQTHDTLTDNFSLRFDNARQYNRDLTVADLTRPEAFDPNECNLLAYSRIHDVRNHIELHVSNMASGFPFECLGTEWRTVEHLYLCGCWSNNTPRHLAIQQDLLTAKSGYEAHQFKQRKYLREMRDDLDQFRLHWMFWCIWQKCLGSLAFRDHLLTLSDNYVLVEDVPHDPVWAAHDDGTGILRGCNAVPKILTLCRQALRDCTEPEIDTDLLNRSGIYILGQKVKF